MSAEPLKPCEQFQELVKIIDQSISVEEQENMARRKRIRTEQSLPTEEKSHATECDDQQMMERRSKEIDYKMSSMPPSKLPNLIKRLSWAIERTDKLCSPPPNLESNADDGNPSRDFGITHQPRKSVPVFISRYVPTIQASLTLPRCQLRACLWTWPTKLSMLCVGDDSKPLRVPLYAF